MRANPLIMINLLALIGRFVLRLCQQIGREAIFIGAIARALVTPPHYPRLILDQIMRLGYFSLPVIGLTAFFTGGVMTVQIYSGSRNLDVETLVPSVVALGMVSQLGPVLAGLMMAGRVSAAIAAEIATMRVSEQIDAIETLSIDPISYLIAPRVLATLLTFPLLIAIADIIGLYGGYVVGVGFYGLNSSSYLHNTLDYIRYEDVMAAFVKSLVFGLIITICGCRQGYLCRGGAEGVGKAATYATVNASILILACNYLISTLLFGGLLL